jgi:uncharacterized LabA/DUF88 family protein
MNSIATSNRVRVFVYVDGFNFYWATRGTNAYPYGWCNWRVTAESYCGRTRSVEQVKYFTSEILSSDDAVRQRQALHIAAMKRYATVILGRFVPRERTCEQCGYVEYSSREKKTDTNIAIHMVFDAAANRYDEAFLVTADMDLLPAVEMITDPHYLKRPRQVTVLVPPYASTSKEFRDALNSRGDSVRLIDMRLANMERLPSALAAELGYPFPDHWEIGSMGPTTSTGGRTKQGHAHTPMSDRHHR